MKSVSYKEILTVEVGENEQIVISKCSEGGYTIGKKVFADINGGKRVGIFLKGAIKINNSSGLKNFKEALNSLEIKDFEEKHEKN